MLKKNDWEAIHQETSSGGVVAVTVSLPVSGKVTATANTEAEAMEEARALQHSAESIISHIKDCDGKSEDE